jgi:3-hydroxybutyryl-CoA dehydrogenase
MSDITAVAVIGGGFMGAGIAESTAAAGIPVVIRELPDLLDAAQQRVDRSLAHAVKIGSLDEAGRDELRSRIAFTSDIHDAGGADLVVEAVPERVDLKIEIMQALDKIVDERTIIASNTSSIPIAQLGGAVRNAERVVGIHFFSPVPVMQLVEVVRAIQTSQETVDTCFGYVRRLGKHPIVTKDRAGFVVNYLLTSYLIGAVRMYEEGFASKEDIDAGMKMGANHPMGPLELCDFVGIDVVYSVCNSLYEEFKREQFAPPPLMKRMVAAGKLGRKSGAGFYDYQ